MGCLFCEGKEKKKNPKRSQKKYYSICITCDGTFLYA